MEINWTVVTYLVIGLFALTGFFRGWWKEGITTLLLIALLMLLQLPEVANAFINVINGFIEIVWGIAPEFFNNLFEFLFGVSTANNAAVQLNPSDASTWLLVMLALLVFGILLGRLLLPGSGSTTFVGSILGGLVGAFNGFLVVSLVREYLDGRALPGTESPATEITLAGGSVAGTAAPGFSVQAVELPRFTILDSMVPWIAIGIGLLIFIAVLRTGFGFRGVRVDRRTPPGYR